MPYVNVTVANKLTGEQFTEIRTGLGQKIDVIEGKSEAVTLIKIDDATHFYKAGEELTSAAFVEIRLFGKAAFEEKQTYAKSVTEVISGAAGIDPRFITINYLEMLEWGGNGNLNAK